MTFADFYLICFVLGFSLCLLSFVLSGLHLHVPFKWHFRGSVSAPHGMLRERRSGSGACGPWSAARVGAFRLNPATCFCVSGLVRRDRYLLTEYYRVWFLLALRLGDCRWLRGSGDRVLVPGESFVAARNDFEGLGLRAGGHRGKG